MIAVLKICGVVRKIVVGSDQPLKIQKDPVSEPLELILNGGDEEEDEGRGESL